MTCPKCGFENGSSALECEQCGVIFAKVTHPRVNELRQSVIEEERVADGRIGPAELKVLGFGLVAAILAYVFPLTRFILSTLVTLFHELGHAVVGWLMGMPSIPAFDFVYGGGLTHHGEFRISLAIAIGLGFAYLGWMFRENKKSAAIIGAVFLVWLFFISTEWRREVAFSSAGHLSEFVLAGILFYKALAGVGWRSPVFERPLGAFVAFFVQIHSMLFAWRLMHDATFLEWYKEGKGGALMNDLEVVALDLHIWLGMKTSIEGVAGWLFAFSFVPILVGLVWYFKRSKWHQLLRALRTADA